MKTITYEDFVSFNPCWLTDTIERAGRFEKMCRMIDAVIDWLIRTGICVEVGKDDAPVAV